MDKVLIGPRTLLYPMPVLLVGTNVNNIPNFMATAWGGIASSKPPMISLAIRLDRHTYKGILQNLTLSVNIPSTDMIEETDYCGITSGAKVDKVRICKFDIFYGKLGNAPLIKQCPVNLECRVVHMLNLGSHCLIVSQIEESHVSRDCLTKDKLDFRKIKPFIYDMEKQQYIAFGEVVAKAFSAGLELKAKGEG